MATVTDEEQSGGEVDIVAAAHTALIVATALCVGVFLGLEIAARPASLTLQVHQPDLFYTLERYRAVAFWASVSGFAALVGFLLYPVE